MRIGHGYDAHPLKQGRPLVLGGVTVPYQKSMLKSFESINDSKINLNSKIPVRKRYNMKVLVKDFRKFVLGCSLAYQGAQ